MKGNDEQAEGTMTLKIGEILIEMGCCTIPQLEQALRMQEGGFRHMRLGEIMVRAGIVTEEELRSGLAEQQKRFRAQLEKSK